MHGVHDLGMVVFFCADLLVYVTVSGRLGLRYGKRGTYRKCEEANNL
jgi:hypothetical protein